MRFAVSLELVGIYCIPVILILLGVLPFQYRFVYLTLMGAFVGLLAYRRGYTLEELGLKGGNIRLDIALNGLLVLVFLSFFSVAYFAGMFGRKFIPESAFFYIFYVLISCPVQEFLYRSYFFALLQKSKCSEMHCVVLCSAIAFSFLHTIYHDVVTLVAVFAAGIAWAFIYAKTKSFYGVCMSHALFGTMTILAGLV